MDWTFSTRAQKLKSSAIRDLLKVTEQPDVISFAGGIPSPQSFPIAHMHAAAERIFAEDPTSALQYGPTEGYAPLREWIAADLRRQGCAVDPAHVLITTGSQQGLDLLAKVLIDPGSRVLVETPTYLGALQAMSLSEPTYSALPCDEAGPCPDRVTLSQLAGARMVYCIPNFQNPTGRRMTLERRHALVALAQQADFPLIEDDPYGALSYAGDSLPSLLSLAPDRVVYLGSFSKLLAPGLRVGYLVAPAALYPKLVQAKQAADLHTASLSQRLVYEAVKDGFLSEHIPRLRQLYGEQCRVMLDALKRELPGWVRWTEPQGGMFVWVQLPAGPAENDATPLLQRALAERVAFVPGESFFAEKPQKHTFRLSFATTPPEKICEGARRLGSLIERHCRATPHPSR